MTRNDILLDYLYMCLGAAIGIALGFQIPL
jgi:hypothetical protein